jgi:flagellar biosynthesis protein FlhB
MKKKQKKKVAVGMIILLIAVSSSLVLKAVFLSNELAIGFSLVSFYQYYTRIFGILAGVEILKAVLYLAGGIFVGIFREKRVPVEKPFIVEGS